MPAIFRVLAILFITAAPCAGAAAADFPLKVSSDGRRFVDQQGTPFFINGDTAWSLIGQLSKQDAEMYFRNCASLGINSVILTLVEGHYADNAPANFYGVQPYTTPNDFTTPNEEYFAHADWVINKAAEFDILVILAPNYLGCCNDGWFAALRDNNTEADARWFGEWVGERYKSFPNLMYAWGNDLNPGTVRNKIRAMAEGVRSRDSVHLQTYHAAPESSALDQWSISESWLTYNITYTYEPVQQKSLEDYNRQPFLPYFLFESQYEGGFLNADALQIRKQAYTAVLSGASGHHYGNNPLWHMNGAPSGKGTDWKGHLDDPGRLDVQHVRELFESRQWHTLRPDQQHELVTSGFGSGNNFAAAAITSDNATAIIYFPERRSLRVDLGQLSGSSYRGWWFNPRDGSATEIDMAGMQGTVDFIPPSQNDWILVIDDESSSPVTPGQNPTVRPNPPTDLTAD